MKWKVCQCSSIGAVFFFICFITTHIFGQSENKIWTFGYGAGISFNQEPPQSILTSNLFTDEGCASVSDNNGNLIFYTDGRTVWDANNNVMPNGFGLMGHISSTQSALITSKPSGCNQYYIFTTDGIENDLINGLRYSVVDMNERNGLGNIVEKNQLLFAPAVEKLVAIPNHQENLIWLIAHEWQSSSFRIYRIDKNGISLHLRQTIGALHGGGSVVNGVGYMKSNSSGTKIALINRTISSVEIFDFNKINGELSNPIQLESKYSFAYGLDFSPDGSKLYMTTSSQLFQFSLENPTREAIITSEYVIATSFRLLRALQLAPNGKIYLALDNYSYLGVINQPNAFGASVNYSELGFSLNGRTCKFGLPTPSVLIDVQSAPKIDIGNDELLCNNETLELNAFSPNSTYLWQDGSTNSTLTISNPGKYFVRVENSCGVSSDTIHIRYSQTPIINIPSDTTLCLGNTFKAEVTNPDASYLWQDGSTQSSYVISRSGTYSVSVSNTCGALEHEIEVSFITPPEVLLGKDTTLCQNQELTLTAPTNAMNVWQDGSTESFFLVKMPGVYSVTSENLCGTSTGLIEVKYRNNLLEPIDNLITPNGDRWNQRFELDPQLIGSRLTIYNRWGEEVFSSNNYKDQWEAQGLANGTYYYQLIDFCKTSYKGWIQVMR